MSALPLLCRCLLLIVLAVWCRSSSADDPASRPASRAELLALDGPLVDSGAAAALPQVSASEDDAPLYDVQFVGARHGWACGAEGVVWHTSDGGSTWERQATPVDCLLRDVQFLTDQVGWIAGEGVVPHLRHRFGVLLATRDGGQTWTLVPGSFPPLRAVSFFGLKEALVVGEATAEAPTGLMRTTDGGTTWQSVPGSHAIGWQAAAFASSEAGVVVGPNGGYRSFAGGRLLPSRNPSPTLKRYAAAVLKSDAGGWIVGEGALMRRTTDGGASWTTPPRGFPQELADFVDFSAVDVIGQRVWIAGSPGSVIWHSADGGQNWQPQPTGQTVPIRALHFLDELNGWAAGELGLLLRTTDGGQSWTAVRGGNRHAALMHVAASAEQLDFASLAVHGGDLGYRTCVLLPIRRDVEPDGHIEADDRSAVAEAIRLGGGAATVFDWQWPVMLPELDRSEADLITEWQKLSDGKFAPTLLGRLVCQLRVWRPEVIIIPEPEAGDAATKLLTNAVRQAMRLAAHPGHAPHQNNWANLPAHQVQKLFLRKRPGDAGRPEIDLDRYRVRLGVSAREHASEAASRLFEEPPPLPQRMGYALDETLSITGGTTATQDFFLGCPVRPGSAARRQLVDRNPNDAERVMDRLTKQKHFRANLAQSVTDDRKAAQIIAHLRQLTRGLEADVAAKQLAEVADAYREAGRFGLAEETWIELIEQYPAHPVSVDAMRSLLWRWCSAEVRWMEESAATGSRARVNMQTSPEEISERIRLATHRAAQNPLTRGLDPTLGPDPAQVITADQTIELKYKENFSSAKDTLSEQSRQKDQAAVRLASLLRRVAPSVYRTPEVQFPLAALLRRQGKFRMADELQNRYRLSSPDHPWQQVAAGEAWLSIPENTSPKPIYTAVRTPARPHLDGLFSDACWTKVDEMTLSHRPEQEADRDVLGDATTDAPRVQCCHDGQFLFFAVTVPRDPSRPRAEPRTTGRAHDADLTGHDRIRLCFDTDRDYLSYFQIVIDERGQVHESCWGDADWNPKLYVAADATETHWRLEIAIPFDQLTGSQVLREVWGFNVDRVIPAKGLQSWTPSPTRQVTPQRFGMLQIRG